MLDMIETLDDAVGSGSVAGNELEDSCVVQSLETPGLPVLVGDEFLSFLRGQESEREREGEGESQVRQEKRILVLKCSKKLNKF